jgi:DhnA family fructose-bisphosphate aldolase class Ia
MGDRFIRKLSDRDELNRSPAFVFAADHLSGVGLHGLGPAGSSYRTHPEFVGLIREIVKQADVDAVLMTPADAELLAARECIFDDSPVTPLVRMNAETGVWGPRGGRYKREYSYPFQTVHLDEQTCCNLVQTACRNCCVSAGLYSITLNNDVSADHRTLSAYLTFAREAAKIEGFKHLLEVFPPNVQLPDMDQEQMAGYVADSIVRIMSHLTRDQRPLLIKTQYIDEQVWEELTGFDPELVIGALGGSYKNARATLDLAHKVISGGGRAVLFGRPVFMEDDPPGICTAIRSVIDRTAAPEDALDAYLERAGSR